MTGEFDNDSQPIVIRDGALLSIPSLRLLLFVLLTFYLFL